MTTVACMVVEKCIHHYLLEQVCHCGIPGMAHQHGICLTCGSKRIWLYPPWGIETELGYNNIPLNLAKFIPREDIYS